MEPATGERSMAKISVVVLADTESHGYEVVTF
jgi:hypothetical protein